MNLPVDSRISPRRKVALSSFCTMQVGGNAEYFCTPQTEEDLQESIHFANANGLRVFILGKGSNVIFPDTGFPGLVISMIRFGEQDLRFDSTHSTVSASAGVYLYKLALACEKNRLGGVEFLASIPGTVGGAIMMNAGFSRHPGQKNEIGDLVKSVDLLDENGVRRQLDRADINFEYRNSNLNKMIVLGATFQLWKRRAEEIRRELQANFEYRNAKQDLTKPSSGSIFKNPDAPHPPAGRLIEQLGLKGTKVGGAMLSERHANYIINLGNASAADVIQLIFKIQKAVFNATQILLEPEVRIVNAS